jgi:ribonuclease BN (tRNA processing enzyme)
MDGRLRLDCLGSANAFSHGRYWSGFLLGGRVLLDCPPQTLVQLYRLGVSSADVGLVLLSHEHSDHIGGMDLFLLDAMQRTAEVRRAPLAIGAPPGMYDRLREVIGPSTRLPRRVDPRIVWFEQGGGSAFEWAGAHVETIKMEHTPTLTALGYRVQMEGRLLAYTGDTRICEAVDRLADHADLLIVECGGDREAYHFAWPDILALRARLPAAQRMLVTHYGDAPPLEVTAAPGIELAEDFATYWV